MKKHDCRSVGTFTIIKNEIAWIHEHLKSWLPHVDEMVFFDGNSTDGTLETIREWIASKRDIPGFSEKYRGRIVLVTNADCKNLQDDYVRIFNACLRTLHTDYAIFAHPDMMLEDPGNIRNLGDAPAYHSVMRNFAGDPGGTLFEVTSGRTDRWKHIYRLHNPDLGLHYHGHYGAWNEDCYFSEVTGAEHQFWGDDFAKYPYEVKDSGIRIRHYSDVRPYNRRYLRMVSCLKNQGYSESEARTVAAAHPRVTLKDGKGFKFTPVTEEARV